MCALNQNPAEISYRIFLFYNIFMNLPKPFMCADNNLLTHNYSYTHIQRKGRVLKYTCLEQ